MGKMKELMKQEIRMDLKQAMRERVQEGYLCDTCEQPLGLKRTSVIFEAAPTEESARLSIRFDCLNHEGGDE